MVNGSPDYTKTTRIQGNFGGDLVTIAVDADGQLYALLKGFDGASYVPISVDAEGRMVAVMTGSDGVDARVLLTDAAGRLISVIQDPVSGFNVAIDADGFMTTVMKGADGATLRTLAVDGSGRLMGTIIDPATGNAVAVTADGLIASIITGLDGGTLRTLMVDASGRLVATIVDATTGDPIAVDTDGYLSTVIKGLDGAALRTVAVDASGNIVGVFQGEFEGGLKTLATDADGRLLAKLVDVANIFGDETTIGNAELAARLGSPMIWSRTGLVANYWDGSAGLAGILKGTSGAGGSVVLACNVVETAGYSMTLISGPAAARTAWVALHGVAQGYSGNIAAEFHWLPQSGNVKHTFYLDVYDGTNVKQFRIQWDDVDNKIMYKNNAGAYVDSGFTMNPSATAYQFNALKLIINTDDWEYVTLLENSNARSMAGISGYSTADGDPPRVGMYYVLRSNDGVATNLSYLDRMILTLNE